MNGHYRNGEKLRKDTLIFFCISVLIHLLFVFVLSFYYPDLQPKIANKSKTDFFELTELEEEETEPPKDSKLLAEKNHKAKKESAPDQTTRLSKTTPSKPALSKRPTKATQKKQPEKKQIKNPEKTPNDVSREHVLSSLPKQKWLRNETKITEEIPKKNTVETEEKIARKTPGSIPSQQPELGARHLENREDTVDLNTTHYKYHSYFIGVKKQIEGVWHYPKEAIIRREYGTLNVIFTISKNGELEDLKILQSSGYDSLDNEAKRAIKVASLYHPFPKSWNGMEKLHFKASFEYRLSGSFYLW